jgi:hypothetical protein
MFLGDKIKNAADLEIVRHRLIAMQQHDRRASPLLNVMEPRAIYLDEAASSRVAALGYPGQCAVDQGGNAKSNNYRRRDVCGRCPPKDVHSFSPNARPADGAAQHDWKKSHRYCDNGPSFASHRRHILWLRSKMSRAQASGALE